MNCNHLEAIALTQKLAFAFNRRRLQAQVEVVRAAALHRPPLGADPGRRRRPRPRLRRPGPVGARLRRLHRRGVGSDARQAGLHLRPRRSQRAAAVPRRATSRSRAPRSRLPSGSGLVPIVCVGEGLDDPPGRRLTSRTPWRRSTELSRASAADQARTVVVAYEPVWAIGTGEVATPEDAQEVCAAIRTRLAELYSGDLADGVRILYGGSVKGSNVAALMAQPDVDGALVGGAGLDPPRTSSHRPVPRSADRLGTIR